MRRGGPLASVGRIMVGGACSDEAVDAAFVYDLKPESVRSSHGLPWWARTTHCVPGGPFEPPFFPPLVITSLSLE